MPQDDPTYFSPLTMEDMDDWDYKIVRFRRPCPTTFDEAFDALCCMYVKLAGEREAWRQSYMEDA